MTGSTQRKVTQMNTVKPNKDVLKREKRDAVINLGFSIVSDKDLFLPKILTSR